MLVLLRSKSKEFEKKTVSYRLTVEARRILDIEAKRLGVDKTKALEIILREYHRRRGATNRLPAPVCARRETGKRATDRLARGNGSPTPSTCA